MEWADAYAREPESKKGMDESQITGAASSYARKYALNGLFAIDDTKDADTQDNRPNGQVSPDKVDMERVTNASKFFKRAIDEDVIEENYEKVQTAYKRLTNDEKLELDKLLKDKAPDSNKMYSRLLKEYIDYKPTGDLK